MREHDLTDARGLGVRGDLLGEECELARWLQHLLAVRQAHDPLAHRPDVEDLVHEHVGVAGEPSDVRTLTGVAREDDGAGGRVEAVAERGEHRRVLHEDGAHLSHRARPRGR